MASSCWVVTEGLAGLKNQAIGLAEALELPYAFKQVKKSHLWQIFSPKHELAPPWPDLLISCGRQSVAASIDVRRASRAKTFTVHIQDPCVDPARFDVVIAPAHDGIKGENVFITQGAIHRVTPEKLAQAAVHFQGLFSKLPRPLISVLVGGKTRHEGFSGESVHDFAAKLLSAAKSSKGALAVTTSRRTGPENEAVIREAVSRVPSYVWDGQGENPYFGMLSLAQAIVVTSDSISMVSEAASTGKPLYIYELPKVGGRHKQFCEGLIGSGVARPFTGAIEQWSYAPLDETRKAADFVIERFQQKGGKYADANARNFS